MVVKITYPRDALTQEEQESMVYGSTHTMYFYDDCPDYGERMFKAWRPGATAEVYAYTAEKGVSMLADKTRGHWLSFDS